MAPLIWVFGEIVPKSVFQQRADVLTPKIIFVLKACSYLFFPLLVVFSALARLLGRLLGDREGSNPFTLREEIKALMQMSGEQGDIMPMEQTMIRRLFNFGETRAQEVMMPLIDVVALEQEVTCGEALTLAREKAHKLMPVYAERIDQIVGVLDTLALLGMPADTPIREHVQAVDYIPGSRSIQDVLLDLRAQGREMAVVVDEFGGAEGIVTIEDVLEEVVEDIQDEYDSQESVTQWIRRLGERDYLVSARVDLDSLGQELGIDLPEGRYASLSGFLLDKAKDIPAQGATLRYQDIRFSIQRATPRVIQEVRVRW